MSRSKIFGLSNTTGHAKIHPWSDEREWIGWKETSACQLLLYKILLGSVYCRERQVGEWTTSTHWPEGIKDGNRSYSRWSISQGTCYWCCAIIRVLALFFQHQIPMVQHCPLTSRGDRRGAWVTHLSFANHWFLDQG